MKKAIYSLSLVAMLGLAGCSSDDKEEKVEDSKIEETTPVEQSELNETSNDTQTDSNKDSSAEQEAIDQLNVQNDEELKASLEKIKGVEKAIVTSMDSNGKNYVLVDVTLTADSTIEAEKFAEEQAKTIKEKYKESIVDVKVIKNGETLAQSTIE